jgi:hypothetical protein
MIKKICFVAFVCLLANCLAMGQTTTTRVVLGELFTSTTCPPCATQNPVFDQWYQNTSIKSQVAIIKYHVWWPASGDPFYLANTADVQARNSYYQPDLSHAYVPRMFVQGTTDAGAGASTWSSLIESSAATQSPVSITLSGTIPSSGGTLNIDVKQLGGQMPAGSYILHTVVTESNLAYTGSNGDPMHHNVMRKMYPSNSGRSFTLATNETKSLTQALTFGSGWVYDNLEVIVFVQSSSTKDILQAAKSSIKDIHTDVTKSPALPDNYVLYQNHPNPFNPCSTIRFGVPERCRVHVTIYNELGQRVTELVDQELQAGYFESIWSANVASGLYLYRIDAVSVADPNKRFTDVKKMVFLK